MIRIEEIDEEADVVYGTVKTVKYQVAIPTTATTLRTQVPVTTATALPTTTPTPTPTVKQTYSPGPDPLLLTGLFALAMIVVPRGRKRQV
jgi:hypothetical protein